MVTTLLVACTTLPESFTLTVSGGAGGGSKGSGDIVTVWSGHDPNRSIVIGWSGDVRVLDDPSEWVTTLRMPERDVRVSPVVIDVDWSPAVVGYAGRDGERRMLLQIPPEPTGLLLALHGTGGSADFVVNSLAMTTLARVAFERGLGVVALEAEEVVVGDVDGDEKIRWDVSPRADSVDLENIARALEHLVAEGAIDDDTPRYVVGMSNGGAMALTVGTVSSFDAAAVYCASGRQVLGDITQTPTSWWLAENDANENVDNDDAVALHEALARRGVRTALRSHPATPLHDERFARVDGLDEGASRALAGAARRAGLVDADGFWLPPGDARLEALVDLEPFASLAPETARGVVDEIRQMQADHQMYDDYAQQTLDFLEGL